MAQPRGAYQKSPDNWLEVKGRGALAVFDAREPDNISGELAKCEAALAKLTASTH